MDRVPLLTGTQGPQRGNRFAVTAEGVVLGRDPNCAVHIDDDNVSREHARVFLHNASVWVQDSGSRNGVFVNEKRIMRPKSVSPGDAIRIGEHQFTIELVEPGEEPGDPPPPRTTRIPNTPTLHDGAAPAGAPADGPPRGLVLAAAVAVGLAILGLAFALS